MRAMTYRTYGGPEVLEMVELPTPEPKQDEVLIAVRAAAVNPADGKWRSGMFRDIAPVPLPHIPGYDVAGIVEKGAGFAKGSRVVAMLDPLAKGGYAEYVCISATHVATIPDNMTFETAAAIPTAGLTGMQVVDKMLNVQAGQRVLVTGTVGALGSAAVYAALQRGARVIAAVRESQAAAARTRGASEVAVLGRSWMGEPFDWIIDSLGGSDVASLARHLKAGGRIAALSTTPIPPEGLPVTPEFYPVRPDGGDLSRLVKAVASGALPITVARVLPLTAAAEAQAAVAAGGIGGKIILKP
jgi:NADPH2:quinone reductase